MMGNCRLFAGGRQLFVVADVFVGLCEEEESERVAKFGGIVMTVVLVVWQSRSGQEKWDDNVILVR